MNEKVNSMPHKIEAFVGGCQLCKDLLTDIEAGKCLKCEFITYDLTQKNPEDLIRKYNIKVVPTILIDRKIKIEGKPDVPFICGDDTYRYFEEHYGLSQSR